MNTLYQETTLTPLRVARMSGYLDWSSQPSLFKHYPEFLFSYSFGALEALHVVELSRMISSSKEIGAKPYHQLTVPSAGNLHPIELYVQIRGVKGVLSGIYHVDALKGEIVLIREVESDGLEASVGLQGSLYGMLFILSSIPFRAEWKYGERSIRYCYLDAGHQLGTLSASLKLYKQKMTILSEFDKISLNEVMGFKNEESVCAVAYSGELKERGVKALKQNLMYVAPTDYSELSNSLAKDIQKCEVLRRDIQELLCQVREEDIVQRRSARYFEADKTLQIQQLETFMQRANELPYPLSCHLLLLHAKEKKTGLYFKNTLIKEGKFAKKACSLLVDQKFVQNADIVFVITSKYFSANTLMQAGAYGNNLYLEAEHNGLGCSGVGAFYDTKMQEFLETDEYILYVCVVGVKKS